MADEPDECGATEDRWTCGVAELLLRAPDPQRKPLVLMCSQGLSGRPGLARWGLPAASGWEAATPVQRAQRIAQALGLRPGRVRVRGEQVAPGAGGPPTRTVIADVGAPLPEVPEDGWAWVPEPEVVARELAPALAARWPALRAPEAGLLVDAANVVGSRPDGWWRDRAGAAERLLREIAAAVPAVLPAGTAGFRWVSHSVAVLEGLARRAPDVPGVEVVRAPGSGDDTIVDLARRAGNWVVVTADRGLRSRLPVTVCTIGPGTLRTWLNPLG